MQQSAVLPEFSCDVRPDRHRAVVQVGGELDFGVAARVAGAVDELLDVGFTALVVDLHELTFLDSGGVHVLVSARGAAERRGCALSLVRGPHHVHRVFELTGTDSLFAFADVPGRR
jgi:anti-sigma B factor antagonist